MVWDTLQWNYDLQNFYKKVIKIRNENPVFRCGSYQTLLTDTKKNLFAFMREYENQKAVVILNNNEKCRKVSIPLPGNVSKEYYDILNDKTIKVPVTSNYLLIEDMPPYSGLILISR
jgi:glycosidase